MTLAPGAIYELRAVPPGDVGLLADGWEALMPGLALPFGTPVTFVRAHRETMSAEYSDAAARLAWVQ